MNKVSITTAANGDVTLTFTRPDDTGTDKSTSVQFEAVEWAKFLHMIQSAAPATGAVLL